MSKSFVFERREFLKLLGLGVAGAATGCATPPADRLIPYLVAPNDVLPGVPYWFASSCTECSAGCGVMLKQREGRVIKIEGNPEHPVNHGGLCARGHAALQGVYNPDRIRTPLRKEGSGWKAIGWDEALQLAGGRLTAARGKVGLLTGHVTGSMQSLASAWAQSAGGTHVAYEPFAYESVREANRRTFGLAAVPQYDFAKARFVLSLGADFLETFGSPVGQARGFAAMRASTTAGRFVAVEPRLSLTGANADEWIAIRPGGEMALALGLARVLLTEGRGGADRGELLDLVSAYAPEAVAAQTDVPAETILRLAHEFGAARPGLAIAGGIAAQSERSVALLSAVNLLNHVAGNIGETVRFDRALNVDGLASFAEVQRLVTAMSEGQIEAMVVHAANPVYAMPGWAGFAEALDKVPFKVALATVADETVEHCDLVLPVTHAIESLGDAEPARGVRSMIQPGMQKLPMFEARTAGDALIDLARAGGFGGGFPAAWPDYVTAQWRAVHGRQGGGQTFEAFWEETLKRGGLWSEPAAVAVRWSGSPTLTAPELKGAGEYALLLYPSPNLYDGRGANKPWLQELPDPTTKAVWGSWAEIHPETARKLGVDNGDPLRVETEAGAVELPVVIYAGVRPDSVAVPLGQGHTAYGRYANGRGVNALSLLPPAQDDASGAVAYLCARAKLSRGTQAQDLVRTQRNFDQADREIAQVIPIAALTGLAAPAAAGHGAAAGGHADAGGHGAVAGHGAAAGAAGHQGSHFRPESMALHPSQSRPGKHTEPLERPAGAKKPAHAVSAYESHDTVRGPRQEPVSTGMYGLAKHRWAMSIDLNACTGCAACVVACSAENNIPSVGPEPIKRGREMHWIRIERFENAIGVAGQPNDVRFVPMMCQHCSDAPCETVCPVYATYHNPEGLNAQIYNRCVGTRYCSNNCPYKVRAFNFFDYGAPEKETFAFPEPMNWQLNPDVTVRSKGVMEKCTMCVQRVLEGKGNAKDEGRDVRDGEIQTACQQSCPTEAIVFGDLLDPESKVAKLSYGDRRYWVLGELNTKPGVTYLKKIQRDKA